jgi:hypothetical protein
MDTTAHEQTTRRVKPERPREPFVRSVLVAAVATLISFAIVDAVYLWLAHDLEPARGSHWANTDPLGGRFIVPAVCFLAGLVALRMRRFVPLFVSGLLVALFYCCPVFVTGGSPAHVAAFEALVHANLTMVCVGWLLNAVLLIEWVRTGTGDAGRPKPKWF